MVTRVETDEKPFQTNSSDESATRSDSPSSEHEPEAALVVPPDGGWGWVVVLASFMCNLVVDGIIFSWGILSKPIQTGFQINERQAAPVGSLLSGFYLLAGPFVSALANKYGFRVVTILGSIIGCSSFCLCYFANNVEFLYVVYGVFGGIGLSMIYMPAVLVVGFYFEKWRALATGLSLCGSGVGTFVMAAITNLLIEKYEWKTVIIIHGCMILMCTLFGAMFRPIEPVRVTLAEENEDDIKKKHEEAVEKLNSMLKLHSKLEHGLTMPPEVKFNTRVSPHTWMGVASNKRYPTAEEVFKGSNTAISRRSSVNTSAIKNTLGNKPIFIDSPVAEKDEHEDSTANDNNEPLLGEITPLRIISREPAHRYSHADLVARPLYRDDIFFGASLKRLPQYTSRTSLGYHLAVTHIPTKEDTQEETTCKLCPEAVRRTLATMLDVSLFRSPTFNILALSGLFTMLGFFVPYAYVTKRAEAAEMASSNLLIPMIGIANVLGRIGCGFVNSTPGISPLWLNNIALSAGGIATIFSGLCLQPYFQIGYCFIFGLAVACFSALRSILVVEYIGLEQLTNCFGLFLLFQGLGALLGTPIASTLQELTGNYDYAFYVSGGFILLSAILCYPIDYISRWEKSRNKLNSEPKV